MYVPKHFEETSVEVLHDLIRAHPLATLVTLTPHGLDANHLPFEINPDPAPFGTLRGHVPRANSLWRDFSPEIQAMAIFQGPESYISPSWYPTKKDTGKVVPTWNYVVVHARGPLRVIDDRNWVRGHLEELTNRHEGKRDHPWEVTDAPADFIEKLLSGLIGLEIPVAQLTGKWKVSQNRTARDREGVVEGLLREGRDSEAAMARLVRQSKDE